jgi:hypothetical protein
MDVTPIVRTAKTYAADLGERVVNTFWQAGVSTLVVLAPTTTWSTAKDTAVAACAAGLGAVGALLKGLVAKKRGDKNSASMAKSV